MWVNIHPPKTPPTLNITSPHTYPEHLRILLSTGCLHCRSPGLKVVGGGVLNYWVQQEKRLHTPQTRRRWNHGINCVPFRAEEYFWKRDS